MKFLKLVICTLLALSLVACAVSQNPNPVIRYGVNTGTSLAFPGLVVLMLAGCIASNTDEKENPSEEDLQRESDLGEAAALGLGAAGIGFVAGFAVGGTVGFFKWAANGFEKDSMPSSIPEELKPPPEEQQDTTVHKHYIDMGG